MTHHRRCCDDPANLREVEVIDERGSRPARRPRSRHSTIDLRIDLICIACGATLATADSRGELFADYC